LDTPGSRTARPAIAAKIVSQTGSNLSLTCT